MFLLRAALVLLALITPALAEYPGGYSIPFVTCPANQVATGTGGSCVALGTMATQNSNNVNITGGTITGVFGAARTVLSTNTALFVAKTGSDANDCLTAPTACLTFARVVALFENTIDCAGFTLTVNVANGTDYAPFFSSKAVPGCSTVSVVGNVGTPASVDIHNAAGDAFQVNGSANITLAGVSLRASNNCLNVSSGKLQTSAITWDSCGALAMEISNFAQVTHTGNCTINATGSPYNSFMHVTNMSFLTMASGTCTLVGTPQYNVFFLGCSENAVISFPSFVWSGGATTPSLRYNIHQGCTVETPNGGVYDITYLPGSTGGQMQGHGTLNDFFGNIAIGSTDESDGPTFGALRVAGGISVTKGNQTGVTTVGALPACNSNHKGLRYTVTDANATTFMNTVAAGGANIVPVMCDGTNWKIG